MRILGVSIVPSLQVERWVGHDVIEVKTLVQIPDEGGFALAAKIVADSTQSKVHLCQPVGCGFLFLTVNIDAADIALLCPDQIGTLDKHTAGAAAGIVQSPVKRFDHCCDQLHCIMRGIKLTLFFCCIDRKFLEEVFVNPTNQVLLFAKGFMTDLVHFINNFFDVIGCKIPGGEGALHKAALQLLAAGSNAVKCIIKRNIQTGSRSIDDGGPASFDRKIIGAIRKCGVIQECSLDCFIIRIKAFFNELFPEVFNTIFKLFANKTQEHQGQHHIALLEEGSGIARLTQNITTFEQNSVQIQFFFCLFLSHISSPSGWGQFRQYHPLYN